MNMEDNYLIALDRRLDSLLSIFAMLLKMVRLTKIVAFFMMLKALTLCIKLIMLEAATLHILPFAPFGASL